jgi:hypothetical protein
MTTADPLRQLSDLGENAVSDIRLVAHDYGVALKCDTGLVRAGRFGGPGASFGDRATQLAVANIVGIVEQYAENVLLAAGSSPGAIKAWPTKVQVWNDRFGVDVEKECPSFGPMWGFYDARNAIMHRRGELTHSQRKPQVYDRLKAAAVDRIGYDIVVNAEMVDRCAEVCVRCVQELDKTAP